MANNLPILQSLQQAIQIPAQASIALGRLLTITGAWPNLFHDLLGRQAQPGSLIPALQQAYLLPPQPIQMTASQETLLGAAVAQRGFNLMQEVSSGPMLGYVPEPDEKTPRAVPLLGKPFVQWATVDPTGCVSIAALERYIWDVAPVQYQQVLKQTGLKMPNEAQLLGTERGLTALRFLKDAHQIWKQLPDLARDNLLVLGAQIPEPWEVYQPVPGASSEAVLLRFLTLAAYARAAAEAYFAGRSPSHQPFHRVALWTLGGLEGFRPPDNLMPAFADPTGPSGLMPLESFLTTIMLTKEARERRDSRDPVVVRLQQIARMMGQLGAPAMQWMQQQTPDPLAIAAAFKFPKELTGALAWSRVVRLPNDLYRNIKVAYQSTFCGVGWEPVFTLQPQELEPGVPTAPTVPSGQVAPSGGGGGGGGGKPPWVPWVPWQPTPGKNPPVKKPPLFPLPGEKLVPNPTPKPGELLVPGPQGDLMNPPTPKPGNQPVPFQSGDLLNPPGNQGAPTGQQGNQSGAGNGQAAPGGNQYQLPDNQGNQFALPGNQPGNQGKQGSKGNNRPFTPTAPPPPGNQPAANQPFIQVNPSAISNAATRTVAPGNAIPNTSVPLPSTPVNVINPAAQVTPATSYRTPVNVINPAAQVTPATSYTGPTPVVVNTNQYVLRAGESFTPEKDSWPVTVRLPNGGTTTIYRKATTAVAPSINPGGGGGGGTKIVTPGSGRTPTTSVPVGPVHTGDIIAGPTVRGYTSRGAIQGNWPG